MTEEQIVGWEEAITGGAYVKLEEGEAKELVIKNWKLIKTEKFEKETVELVSDCVEEDGEKVEKQFTTASNRLKSKLKPILMKAKPSDGCKISIIKVGDKFSTQYSVKKIE